MRKALKMPLIAILVLTTLASGFVCFERFGSADQTIRLPINQVSCWARFLVGHRVQAEGLLMLGIAFIPEQEPPYNCILLDPSGRFGLGILWNKRTGNFDHQNVTVIGVLRFDYDSFSHTGEYYLEAESVKLQK